MMYSQLGYFIAYKCFQYQAKEEMKERILQSLPDSELEAISYSDNKDEIEWEEENKEFFFRGEMYDVVRIRIVDRKTVYLCVKDTKEGGIVQQMNEATRGKRPGKGYHFPTLQQLYDLPALSDVDLSFYGSNIIQDYPRFAMRIFNRSIGITGPPPRI